MLMRLFEFSERDDYDSIGFRGMDFEDNLYH